MKKILFMLMATAIATSCSEFEIYDTPYPDSATINLSVEWTTLHDDDTVPTQYAILNNGAEQKVSAETTYIIDPSASGDFLVYNLPAGITITDGVATLDEATRVAVDPEPNPEHLYYGVGSATLIADKEQDIKISTYRATAPLTLKLSYAQSEATNIQKATIELSGIAQTRDLTTGALSDSGTLTKYPTIDENESTLILEYNIFGTIGDAQELTITFTTTDNQTMIVTSDLTSQLSSFNDDMKSLTLTGNLNLPTDLEVEGSIGIWDKIDEGDVTADRY